MILRSLGTAALLLASAACATDSTEDTSQPVGETGALVTMSMTSDVSVLLDEIPAGPMRDAAAADALAKPTSFWIEKAKRQIRLMNYRLVFRSQYHTNGGTSNASKVYGPLPLPDKSVWNVALTAAPHRISAINGQNHD